MGNETIRIEKAKIESTSSSSGYEVRYVITEDGIPIPDVSRWLDNHSFTSYLTGQRYAYVLLSYLQFLQKKKIHYRDVTDKAIIELYIKYLLYEVKRKKKNKYGVIEMVGGMTVQSVRYHILVLKNFYDWLEDEHKIERNPVKYGNRRDKKNRVNVKSTFLYGQIWTFNYEESVAKKLKFKERRNHIKWYTQDEINQILDNLPSLRDKLIFRLTIAKGMRIGEVLGLKLENFDYYERSIDVKRDLNPENEALVKTKERVLYINENLAEDIQMYMRGERIEADCDFSNYLFLNHKGQYKGKPVRRRNFLQVLKTAAEKCGLNPEKIRTHSGRSTRAQELVEKSLENPELVSEFFILEEMGWKNIETLKHYKKQYTEKNRKEVTDKIDEKPIARKEIKTFQEEVALTLEEEDYGEDKCNT